MRDELFLDGQLLPASERKSVAWCFFVGMVWINGPVLILICIGFVPFGLLFALLMPGPVSESNVAIPLVGGMVFSFLVAWLYWSIMIPRWRIWSLRRVTDWNRLQKWAINQLIWRPGHFFERTEIWSPRQRQLAHELWMARQAELGWNLSNET